MKDFRERRRSTNGGSNGNLLIGKVGSASSLSAGKEQQEVGGHCTLLAGNTFAGMALRRVLLIGRAGQTEHVSE